MENEKALFTIKEMVDYLGMSESVCRRLVRNPANGFGMKVGNKWYANKKRLDLWLDKKCDRYYSSVSSTDYYL